MKTRSFNVVLFASLILGLLFTSCVSNKKFAASEAHIYALQRDSVSSVNELYDCNSKVNNLKNEKASLQNKNTVGENNLKTLSDESKLTIEAQAERLQEFQNIIHNQSIIMNNLKNSISEALINYEADELSIYLKDGNVYVSLQEKLLFTSGSDTVDTKGQEAIKILAKVLVSTTDINVIIEGHADNFPISTAQFEDNWELSSARATAIVRLLTTNYGFDSSRISATGRGQFHPVQTNETEAGRAANRRTEVILSPNLNELYNLLNY